MSKIDDFNKQKSITDEVMRKLTCALGKDRSDNDKHRFNVSFARIEDNNWNEAIIKIQASYGYYGISSGYDAISGNVGRYLAKAIQSHIKTIAETAIKYAENDLREASQRAKNEARSVLEYLNNESEQRKP